MYVTGNPVRYEDPTGHARPTDESENANKPFSPIWFMRRYPYDESRALDEAQKWLEKHQDYNIFADPDAWGVNNGELVPRNSDLHQMYMLWRAARGEQDLLQAQVKAQQTAWLVQRKHLDLSQDFSQANLDIWGAAVQVVGWGSLYAATQVAGCIFVGTPNGYLVPIPEGWSSRVADNGRGIVYQRNGATGNSDMIRIMDPTSRYPEGYIRYYNSIGQPLDVYGKPGPHSQTHIGLDHQGEFAGWPR